MIVINPRNEVSLGLSLSPDDKPTDKQQRLSNIHVIYIIYLITSYTHCSIVYGVGRKIRLRPSIHTVKIPIKYLNPDRVPENTKTG